MAKGKTKKLDAVMKACHELGCNLEKLFEQAAVWVREVHRRTIKYAARAAALAKYRKRSIIPDWVGKYLRYLEMQAA